MTPTNPFHPGELEVQRLAGESATATRNGQVIAPVIPVGAIPFVAQQSFVVLGSVDGDGAVWASLLFGRPGFVNGEDPRRLVFDLSAAARDDGDPLWAAVDHDPRVGGLLIELASRRRLRVNGELSLDGDRAELTIREAYPNCPKYIHRRHLVVGGDASEAAGPAPTPSSTGTGLDGAPVELIDDAVAFFVASLHAERGLDASHRGGPPGFVQRVGPSTLRIPDYPGNSMFNTFGNLAEDPRVGLVFPDFEGGRTLQLGGEAELLFDQDDPAGLTGGTGRFWDVHVARWRLAHVPTSLTGELLDASPFSPPAS